MSLSESGTSSVPSSSATSSAGASPSVGGDSSSRPGRSKNVLRLGGVSRPVDSSTGHSASYAVASRSPSRKARTAPRKSAVAVARAGNASESGVSRVTNSGTPVASSRLQPSDVQPSPVVVQRARPSGGSPGMPSVAGGASRGVRDTARSGPFIRIMPRPVATGSRCRASTATRSTGLPGSTRGMVSSSSPLSWATRSSSTARQRCRSRMSQGAITPSTSSARSARQSSSAVTGRTP